MPEMSDYDQLLTGTPGHVSTTPGHVSTTPGHVSTTPGHVVEPIRAAEPAYAASLAGAL
jgi:hypothetical protein